MRRGRSVVPDEVRHLIRLMAGENQWRAPRIHGELLRASASTSPSALCRHPHGLPSRPESRQNRRTFMKNHREVIAAMDFFVKIAMLRVDAALRAEELETRLLLQVHDELVLEVAEGEADLRGEPVRRDDGRGRDGGAAGGRGGPRPQLGRGALTGVGRRHPAPGGAARERASAARVRAPVASATSIGAAPLP